MGSDVSAILDNYKGIIDSFSGSWEGESYDSLVQKADAFVGEYKAIDQQVEKLDEAVKKYKEYKEKENELNQAVSAEQAEKVARLRKEIEALKGDIKSLLDAAKRPKLTANSIGNFDNNMSFDTNSFNTSSNSGSIVSNALDWAYMISDDDTYGYSQDANLRWGNGKYDCSSFVISAYESAGIPVKEAGATYTGNMKDAFESVGFTWIPGPVSQSDLQPGDVLLNEQQHTEMYIGNGKNIGAHGNNFGGSYSGEISVADYYDHPWNGVLRYTGNN